MAHFTIAIEIENSAFQPQPNNEVARILRDLADSIDGHGTLIRTILHDRNGNRVGIAYFDSQPRPLKMEVHMPIAQDGIKRFPDWIYPDGRRFYRTGKVGTRRESGELAAEYTRLDHPAERKWVTLSGIVYEE